MPSIEFFCGLPMSSNSPCVFLQTRLDVALRIKRSAPLNTSSLSLRSEVSILRLEVVAEDLFPSVEHLLFVEEGRLEAQLNRLGGNHLEWLSLLVLDGVHIGKWEVYLLIIPSLNGRLWVHQMRKLAVLNAVASTQARRRLVSIALLWGVNLAGTSLVRDSIGKFHHVRGLVAHSRIGFWAKHLWLLRLIVGHHEACGSPLWLNLMRILSRVIVSSLLLRSLRNLILSLFSSSFPSALLYSN